MINPIPSSLPPYARMTRFASTDAAGSAYQAIQDFIFRHEDVQLSVYNLYRLGLNICDPEAPTSQDFIQSQY